MIIRKHTEESERTKRAAKLAHGDGVESQSRSSGSLYQQLGNKADRIAFYSYSPPPRELEDVYIEQARTPLDKTSFGNDYYPPASPSLSAADLGKYHYHKLWPIN